MAIISHDLFNEIIFEYYEILNSKLFDYMLPTNKVGSTYDFLAFMEIISREGEELIRKVLVKLLEKADLDFRKKPDRTSRYYVKQTRSRTITTMYGDITYLRTEYVDRYDNKPYIYVDSKLGLNPKDRYAPDVKARIYAMYSDSKSMTDVGKNIGDIIEAKYHNGNPKDYAIPRQTVQRFLKEVKEVRILSEDKKDIETLNISLDEKWIHGQHNKDENGVNKDLMTKAALIFENHLKADESKTNRPSYVGCTYYSSYQKDFKEELIELIDSKYNLESIKTINVMADGANWISEVVNNLKFPNTKLNKGLCPFHTGQALDRITRNKDIYKKAYEYLIHKDIKNFNKLIDSLIQNEPDKKDKINKAADYLKTHIDEIITMKTVIKVPCAMEQAISHHLASQFTCVPKAYSPNNINYYTSNRDAYRNGYNMKLIYAKARDLVTDDTNVVKINKQELDLSFFDKQSPLPYYEFKVNGNTQNFYMF